nr:hypothetical protein [Candidatus Hamiltonella defensa]
MEKNKENVEQKLLPYGNKPFTYAGNLNLYNLVAWLENEAKKLRDRASSLHKIENDTEELVKKLSIFKEPSNLNFSDSLYLNQESNLFYDSNRCSQNIEAALSYLKSSGLLPKDFLGLGLPEEKKQSLRERAHPDDL